MFLCRSMLMLGPSERFYEKASSLQPDIGILDLEDSVAPAMKPQARTVIAGLLRRPKPAWTRGVRINSLRTEEGLRDLLWLKDEALVPDVILVPRVDSPEELRILDQLLSGPHAPVGYLVTIETARGLCEVDAIARSSPRVRALVLGSADFAASTGVAMQWEPLLHVRSRIVAAAAAAEVETIDAPCFVLHDAALLTSEVARVRALGFTGKAAIHPQQVEAINDGFRPSDEEVGRAQQIVAAARGASIAVLDNQMIGPPFVLQARRVLERAELIEARTEQGEAKIHVV